nr:hypothetical protein CFP56_44440 [Quercus suber]
MPNRPSSSVHWLLPKGLLIVDRVLSLSPVRISSCYTKVESAASRLCQTAVAYKSQLCFANSSFLISSSVTGWCFQGALSTWNCTYHWRSSTYLPATPISVMRDRDAGTSLRSSRFMHGVSVPEPICLSMICRREVPCCMHRKVASRINGSASPTGAAGRKLINKAASSSWRLAFPRWGVADFDCGLAPFSCRQ